ncbi:peptidyl-prolyl cis-trans isomerase [Russula compacta]|nr:peptidyl-prolyl cis-trans isomerase [Russula compacta]
MGVEVVVLQTGDGQRPRVGDMVTTHYVGTIVSDGSTFGSSLARGTPFVTEIGVGKAIKGWDEGVLQLTRGSRAILKVSPDYAYGTRGFPPVIPPNATLEFEVELLEIKPQSWGLRVKIRDVKLT